MLLLCGRPVLSLNDWYLLITLHRFLFWSKVDRNLSCQLYEAKVKSDPLACEMQYIKQFINRNVINQSSDFVLALFQVLS